MDRRRAKRRGARILAVVDLVLVTRVVAYVCAVRGRGGRGSVCGSVTMLIASFAVPPPPLCTTIVQVSGGRGCLLRGNHRRWERNGGRFWSRCQKVRCTTLAAITTTAPIVVALATALTVTSAATDVIVAVAGQRRVVRGVVSLGPHACVSVTGDKFGVQRSVPGPLDDELHVQ